jgi:hypothetical protein
MSVISDVFSGSITNPPEHTLQGGFSISGRTEITLDFFIGGNVIDFDHVVLHRLASL